MQVKIWLMFNKTRINPISKETISIKETKNGLHSKISISDFKRGIMRDLLMTTDKVDHQGKILIMEEVDVKTTTTTMEIICRINMKETVMIKIKVIKTKVIKIIVLNSRIKIGLIPNKSLMVKMLTTTNHEKKVFKDITLKIMMVKDIKVIIMDPFPHKNFYIAVQVVHHLESLTTIDTKVKIMIIESINKTYKDLQENIFMIHNRVVGMVQEIIPIKLKKIHTDKAYV